MSSSPFGRLEHSRLVSETERERVVAYLQEAYAAGHLDSAAFDERMGRALVARTRGELNPTFRGIHLQPLSSAAVAARPGELPNGIRGGAALTHLSGVFTSFVGPAIVFGAADPGPLRAEAAKALAFQLMIVAMFVISGFAFFLLPNWLWLYPLQMIAILGIGGLWLVGSGAAALRALMGRPARYPMLPTRKSERLPPLER